MNSQTPALSTSNVGVFLALAVANLGILTLIYLGNAGILAIPAEAVLGLYGAAGALLLATPFLYNKWVAQPLRVLDTITAAAPDLENTTPSAEPKYGETAEDEEPLELSFVNAKPQSGVLGPTTTKIEMLVNRIAHLEKSMERAVDKRVHDIEKQRLDAHRSDIDAIVGDLKKQVAAAGNDYSITRIHADKLREEHSKLQEEQAAITAQLKERSEALVEKLSEHQENVTEENKTISEQLRSTVEEAAQKAASEVELALGKWDESCGELSENLRQEMADLSDAVKTSFTDISETTTQCKGILQDEIGAASAALSTAATRLEGLSDEASEELKASVGSLDIELRDMMSKVADVFAAVTEDAGKIKEHQEAFARIELGDVLTSLENLNGLIQRINTLSETGADNIDRVAAAANLIETTTANFAAAASSSSTDIKTSVEELSGSSSQIEETVGTFMDRLKRAAYIEYQSLKKATESVKKELYTQKDTVAELVSTLQQSADQVEAKNDALAQSLKTELLAGLNETRTQFKSSADDLIAMAQSTNAAVGADLKTVFEEMRDQLLDAQGMVTDTIQTNLATAQGQSADMIEATAAKLTDQITEVTDRLTSLADQAQGDISNPVEALQSLLNDDESGLEPLLERLKSLAETSQEAIDEQTNTLSITNKASSAIVEVSRSLEGSMSKQAELLSLALTNVGKVADDIQINLPAKVEEAREALSALKSSSNENRILIEDSLRGYVSASSTLTNLSEKLSRIDFTKQKLDIDDLTTSMRSIARNIPNIGHEVTVSVSRTVEGKLREVEALIASSQNGIATLANATETLESIKATVEMDTGTDQAIGRLSTDLEGLRQQLNTIIAETSQQIAISGDQQKATLESHLPAISAKLDALSTTLADQGSGGPSADLDAMLHALQGSIETALAAQAAQQSALEQAVKAVDAKVGTPDMSGLSKPIISAISDHISTLPRALTAQFEERFAGLQAKVDQLAAQMADAKSGGGATALNDLESKVNALQGEFSAVRESLETIDASVQAQTANMLSIPSILDQFKVNQVVNGANGHSHSPSGSLDDAKSGISELFNLMESQAETLAERIVQNGEKLDGTLESNFRSLSANKTQIEHWSKQLRNVSTAIAIADDVECAQLKERH